MEDYNCLLLEESRIEFREEMRELRQHSKSQFGDINSQFDEITGKLDAIIKLMPNWLRNNGIEPLDLFVVPSDQVISDPVDVLLEINKSPDPELNCEFSVTKQSWIDSEVHRAKNDGSTYEEISEQKEVADVVLQVFDETTESIREALLEEQMYTKLDLLLDSSFDDVQLIKEQHVEEHDCSVYGEMFVQNGACNVFDKMSKLNPRDFQLKKEYYDTAVTGNVELNEIQEEFVEKPEPFITIQQPFYIKYFDDLTLFDPGGNILYAISYSGGVLPGLFGIAHGNCDNCVEGVDCCKIVMESDTYNIYNEMPKSNSTSKCFNYGVRSGRDTENEVATQGSNSHESQFSLISNEQNLKTFKLFKQKECKSQLHCISSGVIFPNHSQVYDKFSAHKHLVIELCCYLFEWAKSRDNKIDWDLSMWNCREVLLWHCSVLLWRCIITRADISIATYGIWIKRPFDFHVGALAQRCITYDQPAPRLNNGHGISVGNAKAHSTSAAMRVRAHRDCISRS